MVKIRRRKLKKQAKNGGKLTKNGAENGQKSRKQIRKFEGKTSKKLLKKMVKGASKWRKIEKTINKL